MSPIFTIIMVILAVMAVLDLIVGVSNDAINFLNSSLGSKVASIKVILIVAAFGILAGVLTSSGMMEVARNGVFHPEMFTFKEVMFLFVDIYWSVSSVCLTAGKRRLSILKVALMAASVWSASRPRVRMVLPSCSQVMTVCTKASVRPPGGMVT